MASIFNDGIRYPALSKHKERKSAMIIKPMVEGNFKMYIFKNIKNSDYLNLGTGHTPLSVKEIYSKIAEIYPKKIKLKISNDRKRKIDRELLAPNTKKLFRIFPDFKPKKIDEWLPELVMNPKLRISNKIQKLVDNKYGRFSKKIPSY